MAFPRFFIVLAISTAVLAATGCGTATDPAAQAEPQCPDPRPQVCTTIYAPVCAVHSDGRQETHASACNACADDTVVDFRDGSCEDNAS